MFHVLILQDNAPVALYEVPQNTLESAINLAIQTLKEKSPFEFDADDARTYLENDGCYKIPFTIFFVYVLVSVTH